MFSSLREYSAIPPEAVNLDVRSALFATCKLLFFMLIMSGDIVASSLVSVRNRHSIL